jgi:hypothetical protein
MTDLDWFWIGLLTGLIVALITVRLGRRARDKGGVQR